MMTPSHFGLALVAPAHGARAFVLKTPSLQARKPLGREKTPRFERAVALGVLSLLVVSFTDAWAQGTSAAGAAPPSGGTATPAQSAIAQKPAPRFVPVESYNQMVRYVRTLGEEVQRLKAAQPGGGGASPTPAGGAAGGEEAVDLSSLTTEGVAAPGAGSGISPGQVGGPHGGGGHHGGSSTSLGFKLYFDLNLVSRPNITDFTFNNFHTLLLAEITPSSRTSFSFEVNPSPRYYELDYNLTERFQLRAGKIWIPFDDMAPHNIFGGRINVSALAIGTAFLPTLWTDLGVGFKWTMLDKGALSADLHGYVVNGFRSGAENPCFGQTSTACAGSTTGRTDYPNLSDPPLAADNNRDKMLGGRLALKFFRKLSLGGSFVTGRWSDQSAPARRVTLIGADSQLRIKGTELRGGLTTIAMEVTGGKANRIGFYGEIGQKFGKSDQFKLLARGGMVSLDDRINPATTDQTLVGGALLWQPGPIQISIEHSRDLKKVTGKTNYEFTNLRLVVAL